MEVTTKQEDELTLCPHDRDEITLYECAAEGCESCREWIRDTYNEERGER